jgi:hypothetical protein
MLAIQSCRYAWSHFYEIKKLISQQYRVTYKLGNASDRKEERGSKNLIILKTALHIRIQNNMENLLINANAQI